ncbi:MAG: formate dehydrogenase accessory sulfurtransferase FdhD [Verrucomicrobia bacterium]|nr:formate dehydrogenase accessory sulfurtransferase FdhD [Verrucomicrobiota bacterium]
MKKPLDGQPAGEALPPLPFGRGEGQGEESRGNPPAGGLTPSPRPSPPRRGRGRIARTALESVVPPKYSPGTKPAVDSAAASATKIVRWKAGRATRHTDQVAREEPLEIRVQGRSVAVTMRTPGHDRELAAGFLLTEGIIRDRHDVVEILHCRAAAAPDNTLNVFLSASLKVDFAQLTRHVFATSSCGLCGKASIAAVHQHFPPVKSRLRLAAKTVAGLPAVMREAQRTFAQTGGLHASAVFDAAGNLIVLREDVGRHNALDKVLGHGLLESKLPFDSHILLVSGRTSFEIMQKALAARIPIVAAVSAPSSLAVDFARESGQTLIGFLRGQTMNIYSHPERIVAKTKRINSR